MLPSANHVRVNTTGQMLQDFLCAWLRLSRNKAKSLLDSRVVFVNGVRTWMARHPLRKGDLVEVFKPNPCPAPSLHTIEILAETTDYLVVNKPAGCLSNGKGSAETVLQEQRKESSIRAAHRLDRDTSGCLMMARNQTAMEAIIPVFRDNKVMKMYHALVAGTIAGQEQRIDTPLDGVPAITHIRVLSRGRVACHIAARIETGRTHQIRKHLAGIGHPVLGDKQYGTRSPLPDELHRVERQMLHASSLSLPSPMDGRRISAEAPLPPDFRSWMKRLRIE